MGNARNERSSLAQPAQNGLMMYFRMAGLLDLDNVLIFNPVLGTLSHLAPGPTLLQEQQFSSSEVCLLLPILQAYPHYSPYEILLASIESNHATEEKIVQCRIRLHKAQREGECEELLSPIRTILSRVRLKMRTFDLDIAAITETGYLVKRRIRLEGISEPEMLSMSG